jgi:hypothetical protein
MMGTQQFDLVIVGAGFGESVRRSNSTGWATTTS